MDRCGPADPLSAFTPDELGGVVALFGMRDEDPDQADGDGRRGPVTRARRQQPDGRQQPHGRQQPDGQQRLASAGQQPPRGHTRRPRRLVALALACDRPTPCKT